MPRIEIIPSNLPKGDASPSVDVCKPCSCRFRGGSDSIPSEAINNVQDQGFDAPEYRIGSTYFVPTVT